MRGWGPHWFVLSGHARSSIKWHSLGKVRLQEQQALLVRHRIQHRSSGAPARRIPSARHAQAVLAMYVCTHSGVVVNASGGGLVAETKYPFCNEFYKFCP